MVIYEVNVSVNNESFQDYYNWLLPHVQEMLEFKGFQQAEIGIVENQEDDNKNHLRINFTIDTYENLQNYLDQHAANMRAETLKRFGDQYSITRRVILDTIMATAKAKA